MCLIEKPKAIRKKVSAVPQEDFHSSDTSLVIPAAGSVVALTIYSIVAGKDWPRTESLPMCAVLLIQTVS